MRLKTHLITSALAGITLYKSAPRRAVLFTLAGVLVDVDHYVVYASRSGDWNMLSALRYDRRRKRRPRPGDTRPRYGSLRSILHHAPLTLPILWALAWVWPPFRPLAGGVTLHLALDTSAYLDLDWRIWRRARGRCESCRVGGLDLSVHFVRPPHRGGSWWAKQNRAAWCETCAREIRSGKRQLVRVR